jgi:hypothetical protein
MASLKGDDLVVFYYLSASEIWPDKRVAFGGSVAWSCFFLAAFLALDTSIS